MWSPQELRANYSRFKKVAAQAGNTKRIPVSTRFVLKSLSVVSGDTVWGTVNGVAKHALQMPANGYHVYNSFPADAVIVVNAGFELYIDIGLGKLFKVITGA
jgi:hypothetical protein